MAFDPEALYQRSLSGPAPQQQAQPQQGGGLLNFLYKGLVQPTVNAAATTGRNLYGGAFELGRLATSPFTNYNAAAESKVKGGKKTNKLQELLVNYATAKNPYVSEETLSDPKNIITQAKASANLASFAVPFGKGAGFLSKAILPGAAVGGLQSFSDENATPESVVKGAAGGAALAGVLRGATNAVGKLAQKTPLQGVSKAGNELLASQYEIPKNVARNVKLKDTVGKLANYGITDIADVPLAAEKVTGADGILSKATRAAVAKSNRVDTKGLDDIALSLADDPAIGVGADSKFLKFVQKGIKQIASGGEKGTLKPGADPSDTFGFIQQLEKQAASLTRGRNPITVSSQDQALAKAYGQVANELKDRLFSQAGGDKVLIDSGILQKTAKELAQIHPNLGEAASKAKTVAELRSLAAPFVRGDIAAAETEAGAQAATKGLGDQLKGVGKFVQNPLNIAAVPLDALSPQIGNILNKAGNIGGASPQVEEGLANPLLQYILGQGGARAGAAVANQPAEQGQYEQPQYDQGVNNNEGGQDIQSNGNQDMSSISQEINPYPVESYVADIQRDPQHAALYKEVFNQYQSQYQQAAPKQKNLSPTAANPINLASAGLDSLDQLENILNKDNSVLLKQLFPGHLLTREYDSLAHQTADAILRARTGAQANESEIKLYMDQFLPRFGDDSKTQQTKLRNLRKNFQNTINIQASTTGGGQEDYSALMSLLGGQQ